MIKQGLGKAICSRILTKHVARGFHCFLIELACPLDYVVAVVNPHTRTPAWHVKRIGKEHVACPFPHVFQAVADHLFSAALVAIQRTSYWHHRIYKSNNHKYILNNKTQTLNSLSAGYLRYKTVTISSTMLHQWFCSQNLFLQINHYFWMNSVNFHHDFTM